MNFTNSKNFRHNLYKHHNTMCISSSRQVQAVHKLILYAGPSHECFFTVLFHLTSAMPFEYMNIKHNKKGNTITYTVALQRTVYDTIGIGTVVK